MTTEAEVLAHFDRGLQLHAHEAVSKGLAATEMAAYDEFFAQYPTAWGWYRGLQRAALAKAASGGAPTRAVAPPPTPAEVALDDALRAIDDAVAAAVARTPGTSAAEARDLILRVDPRLYERYRAACVEALRAPHLTRGQ